MKKHLVVVLLFTAVLFSEGFVFGQGIIIPTPLSVEQKTGDVLFPGSFSISGNATKSLTEYINTEFSKRFDLKVLENTDKGAFIDIHIADPERSSITDKNLDESYKLTIADHASGPRIEITSVSESGAFYAVQSLMQLIRAGYTGSQISLKAQVIDDAPRFSWRAYMLDEGRYFRGEEQVLMLLDAMAELKMNIFHWHLTDDQGWRIESKKYPLLTQVGSKRKTSQLDGFNSEKYSGTPHEGFYTQDQIKRIVRYANERHIKVVPEIEMPGHASSAIASYPWLGSWDEKIEVPGKFGKHFATFNVTDPRVVDFLKDIVSEMIPLFNSDIIHIGGDEVKFEHWKTNPKIVQYAKDKGYTSPMDIQIAFTNDMSRFIEKKGLSMMGWNEILGKNLHGGEINFDNPSEKVASNVIVQFWKGDPEDIGRAAEDGYRVVNSYHEYTYLDYNFPLSQAYAFDPMPDGLSPKAQKNIIGSGCQMWGEWLTDHEKMQCRTFPRIAAYAEVGWSKAEGKNFDDFVRRLDPFVKAWQAKGIKIGEIK